MLNLKNNYVVPYILFIQLSMSLYPGHILIFRNSHRYRIRDKSRNTSEKQWWIRGGERRITSHPQPNSGAHPEAVFQGAGVEERPLVLWGEAICQEDVFVSFLNVRYSYTP